MFYAIVAGKIWSMITFVTKDNFNYSFAIVVSLFLIPLGLYSNAIIVTTRVSHPGRSSLPTVGSKIQPKK